MIKFQGVPHKMKVDRVEIYYCINFLKAVTRSPSISCQSVYATINFSELSPHEAFDDVPSVLTVSDECFMYVLI